MIDDNELFPEEDPLLPELPVIDPTLQAAVNAAQNVVGEITMIPVLSSDIAGWGYDPVNFKMKIQFTNGRVYLYENVSPIEFEALTLAQSKGSAFWAFIRRNPVAHPFIRLV